MSEVGHVSDTALWVASFRARESARPDALYRDPLAAKLAGERGRAIADNMPYAEFTAWVMAVRTVVIDRLIAEAIADGVDTIVNLGAGLDARPYRLDLPAALRWIEVDFPHLIRLKEERLADEKPRCELRRVSLDLSVRPAAQALYRELGATSRRALVLTEGVVPYLTVAQAGDLADDLRAVASFRHWILDYRRAGHGFGPPPKLRQKLAAAPFRFEHPDPPAFFGTHGWRVKHDVSAIDEGRRLGRPFPLRFPMNILARLAAPAKRERFRKSAGYVLLEA